MTDLIPLMTDETLVEEKDLFVSAAHRALETVCPRDEDRLVDVTSDGYDWDEQ